MSMTRRQLRQDFNDTLNLVPKFGERTEGGRTSYYFNAARLHALAKSQSQFQQFRKMNIDLGHQIQTKSHLMDLYVLSGNPFRQLHWSINLLSLSLAVTIRDGPVISSWDLKLDDPDAICKYVEVKIHEALSAVQSNPQHCGALKKAMEGYHHLMLLLVKNLWPVWYIRSRLAAYEARPKIPSWPVLLPIPGGKDVPLPASDVSGRKIG